MNVHQINVTPEGGTGTGTAEDPEETLSALIAIESIQVHDVRSESVADGLVTKAAENGGTLLIGASRDRRLRRPVFGSIPQSRHRPSADHWLPVLVYSGARSVPERLEDFVFPVCRSVQTPWISRSGRGRLDAKADSQCRPQY